MTGAVGAAGYVGRFVTFVTHAFADLVRAPSQPQRAAAGQRLRRNMALLVGAGLVAIIVLMLAVDVPFISAMPKRGDPALWLVRILTDFGKSGYVLLATAVLLVIGALIVPAMAGPGRARLVAVENRLAFIFLAVAVPNLVGEFIKGLIGRGRPFVGGPANAFNFHPLTWHEPFVSLPSAHATTAFALTFAVAAVWPRTRVVMAIYALLILASRLVLLAHHPSDVTAGAVLGVAGAMMVRHWFAVRGLGFTVHDDGRVAPLPGPRGLAG